jgi:serine/threonine-protein phosphatase 6 regulatory ankyrin repeat subunit B
MVMKQACSFLLDNKADVDAKNFDGQTALYLAVANGYEANVRLLHENGADIHTKNSRGRTVLREAVVQGQKEIAQLLLENGANAGPMTHEQPAGDKDEAVGNTAVHRTDSASIAE